MGWKDGKREGELNNKYTDLTRPCAHTYMHTTYTHTLTHTPQTHNSSTSNRTAVVDSSPSVPLAKPLSTHIIVLGFSVFIGGLTLSLGPSEEGPNAARCFYKYFTAGLLGTRTVHLFPMTKKTTTHNIN